MAHQLPLLDHQYNPTETLRSFSNAVFNYLDTHYEPKGTHLLEPEKMKALLVVLSLPADVHANRQISSIYFSIAFLALSIETVFTAHGPSVTPAGLLAYLRSEIMSNPDLSFTSFESANKAMRLRPGFVRSQFLSVAEPRAKELQSYIDTSLDNTLRDINWSATAADDEALAAVKTRIAFEQMGQQNALDLVSPLICYRCYRHQCTCI
ncbi:hypothetical protein BG015_005547 [Linnemannia schmuckeri]|uniref:DUF7514 domain-containing protein n=1 Tax=Linnemannia schmuckeri TaxID=64567 RepID=A0A9P5UWN8_9FUNG|nr:hypothetical protein BG015_005547 [Linnemannia schmuckeri]